MKIVDRKEFLKLPSGTLFCQCWQRWAFGDLHVKFDSLIYGDDGDGDFVSMPFTSVEADSSEQWLERLEAMADQGAAFPLDLEASGRDGLFEKNALFLIFERDDVHRLRDFLDSILTTDSTEPNGVEPRNHADVERYDGIN